MFASSELLFRCQFNRSSTQKLWYETSWYVNDVLTTTFDPMEWTSGGFDYVANNTLTEAILKTNGISKAGFNLSCAVRAQFAQGLPKGNHSFSDMDFIGIKILQPEVVLKEGETTNVHIQMTVPFGCGNITQILMTPCEFTVEVETADPDGCGQAAVIQSRCGIPNIPATDWSRRSPIKVLGRITPEYGRQSAITTLKVKVPDSFAFPFWKEYHVGNITVTLERDTALIQQKRCSSTNDPYLYTFDGLWNRYDLAGVFTFYRHLTDTVEVQIETENCGRFGFCNCGVAVRSGKTVFELSHCNSNIWHIGYTSCRDGGGAMDVKRRGSSYEVYLPSGAKLQAYIDGSRLNIYLTPSIQDRNKTRGLCGILSSTSDDDYMTRDGSLAPFDQFTSSWRVDPPNNLFEPSVVSQITSIAPAVDQYCSCVNTKITCSAMTASRTCTVPAGYRSVPRRQCTISGARKKRCARNPVSRVRRQTRTGDPEWGGGWTEQRANEFCRQLITSSNTTALCQDVPGVDVNASLSQCVTDIQLSQSTEFSQLELDSVRAPCIKEVMVNPALREVQSGSSQSIFDRVTERSCLGECSGNGFCVNGSCECNTNTGGEDCSVDLTKPPVLYDVADDGHCDIGNSSCREVSVFGSVFTGGVDSKCMIRSFAVQENGHMEYQEMSTTAAVDESISEVLCSVHTRKKRSTSSPADVVAAYNISVSNADDIYSDGIVVLVYDSRCVIVNHTTRQWNIQEGYCIHNRLCVQDGRPKSGSDCEICDASTSPAVWINSNACRSTTTTNRQTQTSSNTYGVHTTNILPKTIRTSTMPPEEHRTTLVSASRATGNTDNWQWATTTSLPSIAHTTTNLPSPGQPTTSLPSPGQPTTNLPSPGQPTTNLPSPGQPTTSLPSPGQPTTSLPSPGQPTTSLPSPGQPTTSRPSPGQTNKNPMQSEQTSTVNSTMLTTSKSSPNVTSPPIRGSVTMPDSSAIKDVMEFRLLLLAVFLSDVFLAYY
ncbi:uncharacterized protein LOC124137891 [Haliotis rufescens]|uniref:uncharacterized protein LOC124137891 n=1 Tax=Haliotis rufescens TaxID=6454 RepID=UPI00201F0CA1|nr:uncharacterized protein LOC124137891 [Haliotis rufescens]